MVAIHASTQAVLRIVFVWHLCVAIFSSAKMLATIPGINTQHPTRNGTVLGLSCCSGSLLLPLPCASLLVSSFMAFCSGEQLGPTEVFCLSLTKTWSWEWTGLKVRYFTFFMWRKAIAVVFPFLFSLWRRGYPGSVGLWDSEGCSVQKWYPSQPFLPM